MKSLSCRFYSVLLLIVICDELLFSAFLVHAADKKSMPWLSLLLFGKTPTVTSVDQVWMDRNLGASRVATSPTDEEAYGDLYQWGRGTDGHEKRNSGTTSILSDTDTPGHGDFITGSPVDWRSPANDNLWQGASGINNPCPAGFRLPMATELLTEAASWAGEDPTLAFTSPLKLVLGGYRYYVSESSTDMAEVGMIGFYWSSSVDEVGHSFVLYVEPNPWVYEFFRADAASVRCIKD